MSEELIQRGLAEGGLPYGDFEYLNIGATSLSALQAARLIPSRDYGAFEARKPDGLVVDRRGSSPKVVAVVEFKRNLAQDDGIAQAAEVGAVLGAKFCVSSDGTNSHWFLPDATGQFRPVHSERGQRIQQVFVAPTHVPNKTAELAQTLVHELSARLVGNQLTAPKGLNPSALARSVWQDIYTAGNTPSPDKSLATFVEIFMFKYLSDLGVLTTDENGTDISFTAVLSKAPEQCLKYYRANVRDYLKSMFPAGPRDKTTIMNGFTLNPDNKDHNYVFKRILEKFADYERAPDGGKLVGIDKEFKSRLFEEFLKGSVGQRSLGQFFTPRRLMAGIVDMADVESLPSGSMVCDPACGVGGFPMEAASRRAALNGKSDFRLEVIDAVEQGRKLKKPTIVCDIEYRGYDKGSDKVEENLTIILAKANFVIYQSDLLTKHPHATEALAETFNRIYYAYSDSSLGSLVEINEGSYDLILSNPPYITSGSANLKAAAKRSAVNYKAKGTGVEGLFLEKIVRELVPGGRAFVIVPDGVFLRTADEHLRQWMAKECFVDGIVSLPNRTFFGVNKKTYVLCLRKKRQPAPGQDHPVFAYIVTKFGETLDTSRIPTADTDMPELGRLYRGYVAVRDRMVHDPQAAEHLRSPRLKLIPATEVLLSPSWAVDRFWSNDEKSSLGLFAEREAMTEAEFFDAIETLRDSLTSLLQGVGSD